MTALTSNFIVCIVFLMVGIFVWRVLFGPRNYALLIRVIVQRTVFRKSSTEIVKMLKSRSDVVVFPLFERNLVLVFSHKAAKTVLCSRSFSNRPPFYCNKFLSAGESLGFNGYTDGWACDHTQILKTVNHYCASEEYCATVKNTLLAVINKFEEHGSIQAFCPEDLVKQSFQKLRCDSIYGADIAEDAQQFLITHIEDFMERIFLHPKGHIINFLPFGHKLFPGTVKEIRLLSEDLCATYEGCPFHHGTLAESLSVNPGFRKYAMDFFAAGLNTVPSLILWIIAYLVTYEEWQELIYAEVYELMERFPQSSIHDINVFSWKESLVHLHAFVYEVMRISPTVRYSLPHYCSKPMLLEEHFIPAKSIILVSLDEAMKDSSKWRDPYKFNPNRFIKKERGRSTINKAVIQDMIGQGMGDRKCLGHKITLTEAFNFTAHLVCKYVICSPTCIDLTPANVASLESWPKPYFIKVDKR